MDQILVNLEKFKIFNHEKVRIDSRICEFHYRLTTLLLFTFTSIITISQLFGTPINCINSSSSKTDHVPETVMNTFCFTQSTFTFINQERDPLTYTGIDSTGYEDDIIYHSYYQWVPHILFVQALILLAPHFIWKDKEHGLMTRLLKTNDHYLLKSPSKRKSEFKQVGRYLNKRHGSFYVYAYAYLLHILLNTLSVFLNMFTTEILLRGYFKYLGNQFINYMWTREDKDPHLTNPLDIAFPKMTKCTFYKYGPSGTIESVDAMCILPLNNFNEKIFIVLWFWYLVLFCISVCYSFMKINQGLSIISKNLLLMKRYFSTAGVIVDEDMKILLSKLDVGQWFVIDIIRLNLSTLYYKDFLKALVDELHGKKHENNNNNVIAAETGCNGQVEHKDSTESHS